MNRMTSDTLVPVVVLETDAAMNEWANRCLPESSFVAIEGHRAFRIYPWTQSGLPHSYADTDGTAFVRVHGFASYELARRWILRQTRKGDA